MLGIYSCWTLYPYGKTIGYYIGIKKGYTRNIIFFSGWKFYVPEFLFEELYKYKEIIIHKGSIEAENFDAYINGFFIRANIIIIPFNEFKHSIKPAENILIDKKDAHYVALVLTLECPIWSNDKDLKKQNKVKIFTTEELTQIIFNRN